MTDNKLPSHWQLGDKVSVFEKGEIVGVEFREGKVHYSVLVTTASGYVTERYVPSDYVVEPIDTFV